MYLSPMGASFRELMTAWDEACISDAKRNQIAMMVEGQNFVLFFTHNGNVFGTHEPHRVTFARMKSPDEETPAGWIEEANFMAVNLSKTITGQPTQQIFKAKDLKDIDIVPDKEAVFEILAKQASSITPQNLVAGIKQVMQSMSPQGKDSPVGLAVLPKKQ